MGVRDFKVVIRSIPLQPRIREVGEGDAHGAAARLWDSPQVG